MARASSSKPLEPDFPIDEPVEQLRPKSPTLKLAYKQLGLSVDAIKGRLPDPNELKRVPGDVAKLRIEHSEQRRQQLVMMLRRKYFELKSAEIAKMNRTSSGAALLPSQPSPGSCRKGASSAAAAAAVPDEPLAPPGSPTRPGLQTRASTATVVDRQLEKLAKKRQEEMERWLANNERLAAEERAQAQAEQDERVRQRELQAVRAQVKRAQAEQQRLREEAQQQELAREEALFHERQRQDAERQTQRLLEEQRQRVTARKAARDKDEEAKRRIEARRAETAKLLATHEEEVQRRAQQLAERQAAQSRRAEAEKQIRAARLAESRARAAARVVAAAAKHDRQLEQQRDAYELKQRALEERRQVMDRDKVAQLMAQRRAYEQRSMRRVHVAAKAEEVQQQRVSSLLHKLARQEAAMEEVQRQSAVQALVRQERTKLREEDARENLEMLARSQVYAEMALRQKFRQDDEKTRAWLSERQALTERHRREAQQTTMERQKIAEMLSGMQQTGKFDPAMLQSITACGPPSAPTSPRASSASRAPRPHTASPRMGGSKPSAAPADEPLVPRWGEDTAANADSVR